MRWLRIVLGSLVAEVLPIAGLIAVVAALGPHQAEGDRIFAEQVGRWFGPVAGFVATFGVGYWVARRAPSRPLLHGLAVGAGSAIVDVAILVATSPPFDWVFVASNLGRVLAGWLAGTLAATTNRAITERSASS